MSLKEHLRHKLIGTPIEPLAQGLRRLKMTWQNRKTPEIRDAIFEDEFLHRIIDKNVRNGMNCVDIGAHLGAVTHLFCKRSPTGRHTTVEPTPYKVEWLKKRYTNVRVYAGALADAPGQASFFHQPKNSGYSGLAKHEAGVNDASSVIKLTVPVTTLDVLIPADEPVHFMKMYVEGAEYRVLKGATRILENDRPTFIFECTESGLASNDVQASTIFGLLSDAGYAVRTPRGYLETAAPLALEQLERAMHYPFLAFSFVASPK